MLDITKHANDAISFWERQPTDQPYLVNGFNGTWSFSDHKSIPEPLHNFIMEAFHPAEKFKKIPIEDINTLMNDVWEGPGSMAKLEKLLLQMRMDRQKGNTTKLKFDEVKTMDDYDESDFQDHSDDEDEVVVADNED